MNVKGITLYCWGVLFFFIGCSVGQEQNLTAEQSTNVVSATQIADQQLLFAVNCFHQMLDGAEKEENTFYSPFGLCRMLGAISLGAEGKTKKEIDDAMAWTGTGTEWAEKMTSVCQSLAASKEVQMVGGIWIKNNYSIEPAYLETLYKISSQEVQKADFSADGFLKSVNDWFAQKTADRVTNLVESISPDAQMLLADAITFQGEWKNAFDPKETRNGYFTALGGTEVHYPIMQQKARFPYYKGDGWQYLEMPYQDGRYSMAIFLPDKQEEYLRYEKGLAADTLRECRAKATETELDVRFPKFSLNTNKQLGETLRKMGILEVFGMSAELRPIAEGNELRLEQLAQGAFLKVEEKGTEAAAATVATFTLKSAGANQTPTFYVDRPFLYFIRHNADGAILFWGRFVDPSQMAEATEAAQQQGPTATIVSSGTDPAPEEKKVEPPPTTRLNTTGDGGVME